MGKYDNKFKDGENDDIDRPRKRKKKRVYNSATGKHQNAAPELDPTKWWKEKLGVGNKAGEGSLAKRRKKVLDDNIRKGSE